MEIYSIGFTQTSAANFFGRLKAAQIERLLDVRLNNISQLAGFAKRDDLAYFLREIAQVAYQHEPLLAPTADILDKYRKNKNKNSWADYEVAFNQLLAERRIEETLDKASFARRTVLLCSEATAENCHRRLVMEYLQAHWEDVTIIHL